MLSLSTRSRDSLRPAALLAILVAGGMLLYSCIAHAAAAPDPATTASPLGWPEYLGIGLAALAGIKTIVDVLLDGLRWLAPRTKTTIDDTALRDLRLVHDKLDALTQLVADIVPPKMTIAVVPPRNSQAGVSFLGCMVALTLAGVGVAVIACTAAERQAAVTDAKGAVVNCTAQALGTTPGLDVATLVAIANTVAAERVKCTPAGGSLDWHCVEADLLGEGKVLGGCALVKLVETAAIAATPTGSALASSAPVPPGRAELEDFRARVGGGTWHTATGDY